MAQPSMRAWGVQRMISRSLNVPGSDSSALQHEVVRLAVVLGHEGPLEPGREAGAAAPAEARLLHLLDHLGARHRQRLPQGRVAAALPPSPRKSARRRPRNTSRGPDRFLRMTRMRIAHVYSIPLLVGARMPGTRSGVTLSMKSSSTRIGVAKPQAPRHSTSIDREAAVGAGGAQLTAAGLAGAAPAATPRRRTMLQGDVVHTWMKCRPTGCVWYMV